MRLTVIKSVFSLANLQIYWIFVILCGVYVAFGKINTPEYVIPVMVALVAAGLAMRQVGYRWISFVCIFIFGHIVAYPLATLIVLSLTDPALAIEMPLWETVPISLWGMSVGMMGLMFGVYVARLKFTLVSGHELNLPTVSFLTPAWFNVALMLLIVPVVLIYIDLGIYYHKDVTGVDAYNFNNATTFGFVGYLSYVSNCGMVLQLRRYLTTKTKTDFYFALICVVFSFMAMAPSGSRANSMIVLAIAFVYFMEMERSARKKIAIAFVAILMALILTTSIEFYRITAQSQGNNSIGGILAAVTENVVSTKDPGGQEKNEELTRVIVGRRLSDNVSVGYLMDRIPRDFPHREFEDLHEYLYYLLPTALRPNTSLDYNYDAILMEKYGFRTDIGGSSPMMIIGDFYDRFGWVGIFLGMACVGFLLRKLDCLVASSRLRGTLLWVMLFHAVVNMYTYSSLKIFTLVTRQLVIFYILAYILEHLLEIFRFLIHAQNKSI